MYRPHTRFYIYMRMCVSFSFRFSLRGFGPYYVKEKTFVHFIASISVHLCVLMYFLYIYVCVYILYIYVYMYIYMYMYSSFRQDILDATSVSEFIAHGGV